MCNFSDRLLDERKRLKKNQAEMASIGGVAKRTYCNYESGDREPTTGFLASISAGGADVQYLLTGIHGYRPGPPSVLETARQQAYIDAVEKADELGKYENSAHLDEKQPKSVTEFTEKPLTNVKCSTLEHLNEPGIADANAETKDNYAANARLPLDEQMMLLAFRALDKAGKTEALGMISGLSPAAETESKPEPDAKPRPKKSKTVIKGSLGQQFNASVGQATSVETLTIHHNKKK